MQLIFAQPKDIRNKLTRCVFNSGVKKEKILKKYEECKNMLNAKVCNVRNN